MTMSLAELLVDDPSQVTEVLRQRVIRLGVLVAVSRAEGFDLVPQVATALASFLSMPVSNVVLWAWDQHQAVQGACRQTNGRPGATARVVVKEHTLKSVQRPTIYLEGPGPKQPILDVELSLTLNIQSVVIDVEEGRVVGAGAGHRAARHCPARRRGTSGAEQGGSVLRAAGLSSLRPPTAVSG
jgi:hypothetical protein